MKHVEARPSKLQASPQKKRHSTKSSWMSVSAIALIFVVGLGYGLTKLYNPVDSDNISTVEKQQLVDNFTKLESIKVKAVEAVDLESALETMKLSPVERKALRKTLGPDYHAPAQGRSKLDVNQTVLAWLSVWDFASQDGDIIHISSAGYEIDVPLLQSVTRIAVPVDASSTAKIIGATDGGGGITLGIMSGASPVSFPVIGVGQPLLIPLSF